MAPFIIGSFLLILSFNQLNEQSQSFVFIIRYNKYIKFHTMPLFFYIIFSDGSIIVWLELQVFSCFFEAFQYKKNRNFFVTFLQSQYIIYTKKKENNKDIYPKFKNKTQINTVILKEIVILYLIPFYIWN